MRKKKRKVAAVFLSVMLMVLTACGNGSSDVQETAAPVENEVEENEDEAAVEEEGEESEKEDPEETEIEEPEVEEILIPYAEENELEFCEDLTIPVKAVRVDINDRSVYEEVDAECVIKDVSIEEMEDGTKNITIKYEVIGELYDSFEKRLLEAIMPNAVYCDLNTGELQDLGGVLFDDEEAETFTVEWNGEVYEIAQTKVVEWSPKPNWKSDGKNGYVTPVTMYATDSFIIPKGYDSLGMVIGFSTAEEVYSGAYDTFDDSTLILDILGGREYARLYNINELCKLFSEDEVVADNADNSSTASSNNGNLKENTTNSSSKDSTTPKQEQQTHTHSYSSSVTKNPTCSENGEKTFVCSCGSSYKEAIPLSGHSWVTTTETVSHPSTGHYETVTETTYSCMNMNVCGYYRYGTWEEFEAHCKASEEAWNEAHADFEWNGSSEQVLDELSTLCTTDGFIQLKETKEAWIVDSDAYEETVTVTKCAICGKQG